MASWVVGGRDAGSAHEFMQDLANRLRYRVQLTTDGHKAYLEAVEGAFGSNIDYAMLVKIYGNGKEDRSSEARYSPAECNGARTEVVSGEPNKKHVSTSYVERQNLTMRMHMRRFTRLTNGFSKKIENHISLHFMYYNFVRIHQTLRVTPAMAAGVTDRVWEISDIVTMLEARETEKRKEKQVRKVAPYLPS